MKHSNFGIVLANNTERENMRRKNIILYIFPLFTILFLMSNSIVAQSDVLNSTKTTLIQGNSKDLARNFNEMVEISFEGEKASYSKTQAEFVMKDFFRKYPPVKFEYIHEGSSKDGLKYAIGKYSYGQGSFRVYILIKLVKGNYLIDTLDFSEE